MCGAATEQVNARRVLEAIPAERRIDLLGVDLATTAAAFRRCALYVGNDSGLMHLAAASEVPTLGLFGPTRAEHYAPWGRCTAVACTSIPYERLRPPGFDPRGAETLMDSLDVEAVERAAVELWRRCGGRR